jgi:hypothetical protein
VTDNQRLTCISRARPFSELFEAMTAHWKDPSFDPKQRAFYYVRVIEIATPRWTTYDAKFFGTQPPAAAPTAIQERAYTSPIWYSPT